MEEILYVMIQNTLNFHRLLSDGNDCSSTHFRWYHFSQLGAGGSYFRLVSSYSHVLYIYLVITDECKILVNIATILIKVHSCTGSYAMSFSSMF